MRSGGCWSGFWKTGIEEDCHLLLGGKVIPSIDISVSVVRWRSTFRIELLGTEGYGLVEGRGRSYGPANLSKGRSLGVAGRTNAEPNPRSSSSQLPAKRSSSTRCGRSAPGSGA